MLNGVTRTAKYTMDLSKESTCRGSWLCVYHANRLELHVCEHFFFNISHSLHARLYSTKKVKPSNIYVRGTVQYCILAGWYSVYSTNVYRTSIRLMVFIIKYQINKNTVWQKRRNILYSTEIDQYQHILLLISYHCTRVKYKSYILIRKTLKLNLIFLTLRCI